MHALAKMTPLIHRQSRLFNIWPTKRHGQNTAKSSPRVNTYPCTECFSKLYKYNWVAWNREISERINRALTVRASNCSGLINGRSTGRYWRPPGGEGTLYLCGLATLLWLIPKQTATGGHLTGEGTLYLCGLATLLWLIPKQTATSGHLTGEGTLYLCGLATLLNGTNVRLNWNIESDLNVYWIKLENFLSLYWFKSKQYWI